MNKILGSLVATGFALSVAFLSQQAAAQAYPSKPITMIGPYAPGSGGDLTMRSYLAALQEEFKQPVIFENRPGAGGAIGVVALSKAAPDGYTLGFFGGDSYSNVFGPEFPDLLTVVSPVIQLQRGAFFLITSSDIPATSAKEFIDFVRASPGKHNYAAIIPTQYLPMELIKSRFNLNLVEIRYKGIADINSAFLRNEVTAYISNPTGLESAIAQKKVRFLAYLDKERNPYYPNIPTAAEAGLPGLFAQFTLAVWVPIGTPQKIILRVNAAFNNAIKRPEVQKFMQTQGAVPVGGSPQLHYDHIKAAHAFWAETIRVTGVKAQ